MAGADSPQEQVRAWLGAPEGALLAAHWGEDGTRTGAFQAFYGAVLAHIRVHPPEALAALDRVTSRDRRPLTPFDRARATRLRAHVLSVNGRYAEAERAYADAWRRFGRLGERKEQGATGLGWTTALTQLAQYTEGERVVRETRRLLPRSDVAPRARLEANHGILLMLSGQLDRSLPRFLTARRRLTAAGLVSDARLVDYNLGRTLLSLGRTSEARRALSAAADHFRSLGATSMELYCRTGLALVELVRGEWESGLATLADLESRLDGLGDARAVAAIQRDQAEFLSALGILERAEVLASRSLAAYHRLGLRADEAHVSFMHARILASLGRHMDARVRLVESVAYWRSIGDVRTRIRAEIELARVLLARGDTAGAVAVLRRVSPAAVRRDRGGSGVRARHLQAQIRLRSERARLAARTAREAFRDAVEFPSRLERPWIAVTAAKALAEAGEGGAALRWVRRAVGEMERIYITLGSQAMRGQVGASRDAIYRGVVTLVLSLDRPDAPRIGLDLLSRARSPQLVEDLLRRRGGLAAPLRTAIARLRDELLGPSQAGHDDIRASHLGTTMKELDRSLASRTGSPPRVVRQAWESRGFASWSRTLGNRSLVFYDRGDDGWSAFVVTGRRVRRVPLPKADGALAEGWMSLRLLLEQAAHIPPERRSGFLEATSEEAVNDVNRLRQALWDPLEIPEGPVVVIPVDVLQTLPLEAITETAGDGRWTVTRWPHPALVKRRRRSRSRAALLLHDRSPGTRSEVRHVSRLLRGRGIEVQSSSRREDVVGGEQPLSLLHVAAHGAFHRQRWLLNGIRLADGWLGFEQLDRARLRDALLVFGSCESGLASEDRGSELDGWMSAGLAAGAAELVLTLWKVDDAAVSAFADAFYPRWCEGMGTPEAAAAARRDMRQLRPHPFAWAPFLTVG